MSDPISEKLKIWSDVTRIERTGECAGCYYADRNGICCEFCARNYPDRYSAKTEGEKNDT